MPVSDSTEALRYAFATGFCPIGVSVNDCAAIRERAVAAPRENFSNTAFAGNSGVGVGKLNLTINNNPPQQWEVQPITTKLDELINALRRP